MKPRSGEQGQALNLRIYPSVGGYVTQTQTNCQQHILVLKGTKHQLSVYDKMPVLHFNSVSTLFKNEGLKCKLHDAYTNTNKHG